MAKKTAIYIVSTLLFCSFLLFNLASFSVKNSIASDSLKQDSILKPDTIQVPGKDLPPKDEVKTVADTTYKLIGTGVSSWYGSNGVPGIKHTDNYHGKTTANGEKFNTWEFTAACLKVPLCKKNKNNSLLRVTNPVNGKSIIVRVTDRGPYAKGRIIDLSYAGKQALELGDLGKVTIEQVIVE